MAQHGIDTFCQALKPDMLKVTPLRMGHLKKYVFVGVFWTFEAYTLELGNQSLDLWLIKGTNVSLFEIPTA